MEQKIVQARCRRKFNYNMFQNKSQIFKLVRNFEAHRTSENHRAIVSSTSGPPITRNHLAVMCICYQLLHMLHSTVPSTEQQTSWTCTLGSSWHFWFMFETIYMVTDSKMLSFYLSINVIFITLSFVVFDLYSITLFQKLWNTMYILFDIKVLVGSLCNW